MTTQQKRPVVLIIRDGWGNNPYPEFQQSNAIHLAKTPVDDWLRQNYPNVLIHTSGEDVGLPAGGHRQQRSRTSKHRRRTHREPRTPPHQ